MSSPNAKSCHSPNSSSVGVTAPSDNCEKCENKSLKLQPTSTSVEVSHSTQKEEQIQEDFTHPLDDLTDREIKVAVQLIKAELGYPKRLGFCQLRLNEPSKQAVLDFDAGIYKGPIHREAWTIVLDQSSERTYEIVVALTPIGYEHVVSCVYMPGIQPPLLSNEYEICEDIVKNDPRLVELLRKRGIDVNCVMVDLWIGFFNDPRDRIGAPLLFYRTEEDANGYARPIDGIKVMLDLNKMKVLSVEELFEVPIPPSDPPSDWQKITKYRSGLKPIQIIQPEGVSFEVEGRKISWQNWSFRVGFTKREGLVLYTLSYNDNGRQRPIIYRASIAEMVVPYGDPRHPNYMKNAFDAGEDGLGTGVHSLDLGCDCLGAICYLDVIMSDGNGTPYIVKNAICIHEEDYGTLWKHKEWRTGATGVRRSRRLVVSYFTTIANYDYGLYWYFYLDGTIKFEAKLTGILSVSSIKSGESPYGYGVMVAPNLYAPIHQHFFSARLDMMVDGFNNAVQEVNVQAPKGHEPNPFRSAFYAVKTTFHNESDAQRIPDYEAARCWKVINTKSLNRNGEECGWRLIPTAALLPFANHDSAIMFKAGFLRNSLWVTPFDPSERYPAGNYTVQKAVDDGLTRWTKANRNIYNTNVVLWHNFGITHITRAEDWPVMPMEYCGFVLKPDNFFDWNPSMDVPPQNKDANGCCQIPVKAKL